MSLVGMENLQAFLNYNVSARHTGEALAVVQRRNSEGRKEEVLTVVDLKTANLWQKIVLWWNDSLKKRAIGSYLSGHIQQWSAETVQNHADQVKLEKQCAWLSNKIRFTHNAQWKLHVTIQYPLEPSRPLHETHAVIAFNRLTTNEQIHQQFQKMTGCFSVESRLISANLMTIFSNYAFAGHFQGAWTGTFLNDSQVSGDRSCTFQLAGLRTDLLKQKHDEIVKAEAYQAGFSSGRAEGYSQGLSSATTYVPYYRPLYVRPYYHHRPFHHHRIRCW